MSTIKLTRAGERNLLSINREYFSDALKTIYYLGEHPDAGIDVPDIQYQLDWSLRPPLKQYVHKCGAYTLFIYFFYDGEYVWIEQIRLVAMM
jgi:hypothetical protein